MANSTDGLSVGIVFSASSAKNFYDVTDYSRLFMAAQSQAMMAGIPFDILSETDLTNAARISKYDALIFPAFANVPKEHATAIKEALKAAAASGTGLIAAGDFMTGDASGASLPGDAYARMKELFGVTFQDGATVPALTVKAHDISHPVMSDYSNGEVIHQYSNVWTSYYSAIGGGARVLATQQVGANTYNAVLARESSAGKFVHFGSESLLADHNLLHRALDWTAQGAGEPMLRLQVSRAPSVLAMRVDMDESMKRDIVSPKSGQGIYDVMLPILERWKQDYDLVGSYYLNIGNSPPAQTTNWSVSKPYYDRIMALGNEIGTHSYTHPGDVNTLTPARLKSEFADSKQVIETRLGIRVLGAAVPGNPDNLPATREIMNYVSYLTGGSSQIGAGYPGAFGYLTPNDMKAVNLAPNMSPDYTLVEDKGMTAAQAGAAWQTEWAKAIAHAKLPVVVWPVHDYSIAQWYSRTAYTTQMFTDIIARAHQARTEFVTLSDLAQRVRDFEKAQLSYSASGDAITARVGSGGLGAFALDLDGGARIRNVGNWYAYDGDSVFLPEAGGTFTIKLGATPDDVTRITSLPSRARLLSVSGDGTALNFSLLGEGKVLVDLKDSYGADIALTGARISSLKGDKLELSLNGPGRHTVSIRPSTNDNPAARRADDQPEDTVPPLPPVVAGIAQDTGASATDGITNDNRLLVRGTAEAGSTVAVFLNETFVGRTTADAKGAWTFQHSGTVLADGSYAVTAHAIDPAGNTSHLSPAFRIIIDTAPPAGPTLEGPALQGDTAILSGRSEPGSMVTVFNGKARVGAATADDAGSWSLQTKLADAVHRFTATAEDRAGNTGESPGAILHGSSRDDALTASPGKDRLIGAGGNDRMSGEAGADTFAFRPGFGKDVIMDFEAGSARTHDVLEFPRSLFQNYDAVMSKTRQVEDDVVITADASNTITLLNVAKSNLVQADFALV